MSRHTDPFAGDPAGPGAVANARGGELIADSWKLKWQKEQAKSKPYAHGVVLVGEELAIVQRAGGAPRLRLPYSTSTGSRSG